MSTDGIMLTKLAECAGCGAKVGAGELSKLIDGLPSKTDDALLVGFERRDDACIYKLSDELCIIETVDFFPPVADDPVIFGRIAAANALSDIYAMGGEPFLALNLLCTAKSLPDEAVRGILRGGAEKVFEAGAIIAGGHSIIDDSPKYGLCVTGRVHPDKIIKNCGAREGDALILTKPLGVGITMMAAKAGLADGALIDKAYEQMQTLNKYARDIMTGFDVHACTDITGFGLLGHLCELTEGSGISARLSFDALPVLDGVYELARMGMLGSGAYRNRRYAGPRCDTGRLSREQEDILFDPQTSGGLLICVAPDDADALCRALKADPRIQSSAKIGVCENTGGPLVTVE